MIIGDKYLAMSDKATKRRLCRITCKCIECGKHSAVTDKDEPCHYCGLCGSLAWLDEEDLK